MKNLNFGLFISYFCANLNLQRCINSMTEAITFTITEIESSVVDELITIESLEKLFIEQCLKQMPRHVRPEYSTSVPYSGSATTPHVAVVPLHPLKDTCKKTQALAEVFGLSSTTLVKDLPIKECTEELSIEKSMDDSLEEKKTLDTEIEKNVGTANYESDPTFSDYTHQHKQPVIKNDPVLPIRSIQIKPPTPILLHPRFMQISRQTPQKYIPHLRKMF